MAQRIRAISTRTGKLVSRTITLPKSEIDKFNKNLDKEVRKVIGKASQVLVDETLKAHGQMSRTILVDTGTARRATLFQFSRENGLIKEAKIGTYVTYAKFIERYKKYFKPAIDRARKNLATRLKGIIK